MAVNKVEVNGETKLDLTQDTVTPESLLPGVTAHNAAGDPISGAAAVVRYDKVQRMTDAQKAQARKNINSAPGGFGWGEAMKDVLASDAEDTYKTYCGKLDMLLADMPDGTSQLIYTRGPVSTGQYSGAGNIVAGLSKILGTSASLIGLSPDPRGTTNGLWRMLKDNGNWQPVEWINPPMQLGVEYRTIERYLGKPVYVQVVDFGQLPNKANAGKEIPNMDNVDKTIRWAGLTSLGYALPGGDLYTGWDEIAVRIIKNRIDVKTTTDESAYTATFTLWYTKTTD